MRKWYYSFIGMVIIIAAAAIYLYNAILDDRFIHVQSWLDQADLPIDQAFHADRYHGDEVYYVLTMDHVADPHYLYVREQAEPISISFADIVLPLSAVPETMQQAFPSFSIWRIVPAYVHGMFCWEVIGLDEQFDTLKYIYISMKDGSIIGQYTIS